jgi:hypothetical protein
VRRFTMLAAVATVVLAGCSGDDGGGGASTDDESSSSTTEATTTTVVEVELADIVLQESDLSDLDLLVGEDSGPQTAADYYPSTGYNGGDVQAIVAEAGFVDAYRAEYGDVQAEIPPAAVGTIISSTIEVEDESLAAEVLAALVEGNRESNEIGGGGSLSSLESVQGLGDESQAYTATFDDFGLINRSLSWRSGPYILSITVVAGDGYAAQDLADLAAGFAATMQDRVPD